MNPALLAILLQQFALPEIMGWLASRNGKPLTDADIIQKLAADSQIGVQIGEAYLAAHPK